MWGLVDLFDGNWVDVVTLVVALIYAIYHCWRFGKYPLVSKETALRVAHGVALFPLILLMGSSVSSHALNALLHSHKVILSVAGFIALMAILEEAPPLMADPQPPANNGL